MNDPITASIIAEQVQADVAALKEFYEKTGRTALRMYRDLFELGGPTPDSFRKFISEARTNPTKDQLDKMVIALHSIKNVPSNQKAKGAGVPEGEGK